MFLFSQFFVWCSHVSYDIFVDVCICFLFALFLHLFFMCLIWLLDAHMKKNITLLSVCIIIQDNNKHIHIISIITIIQHRRHNHKIGERCWFSYNQYYYIIALICITMYDCDYYYICLIMRIMTYAYYLYVILFMMSNY